MEYSVARQPIFDRHNRVYAYELLFRSNVDTNSCPSNGDQATASVLEHSFMSMGIKHLTGGKLAFVNFTQNLLLEGLATIFPKELIGIEILENVEPDEQLVEKCRELKALGYLLILDDFVWQPEFEPLLQLAEIVKIDFLITQGEERKRCLERINLKHIKYLAEKVETLEDYQQARELGYEYFQGYYFTRPQIMSGQEPAAHKLTHLRMLQQIQTPEIDFRELEHIIKQDVSLSYKLLRYVNSAFFGLACQIRSIKHALSMIGLNEARKWLSLILLSSLADNKPVELVKMSLLRGTLCATLARLFKREKKESELFLMGLLSLMDALLDQPMAQILSELPLAEDIKRPLLGEPSPYQPIYQMVIAYEKGDWETIFRHLGNSDFRVADLTERYLKTVEYSEQILQG